MGQYKYGALPAVRPFGLSTLATYATGKLAKPPASVNAPTGITWGMDGNDSLGDCTIAGVDHLLAAWNKELGQKDHRPTLKAIESTYFKLTGGPDSGLVEADVLKTWYTNNLFGNKIAGYAPVETNDLIGTQQAIAFYGGSYFGISCPQSAQEQFSEGQPWTYVPGSPIEGGHCIVGVGYTPTALLCVTWGKVIEVTYSFMAHYCTETWAILSHELVEKGEDALNINLKTLQADLAGV